VTPSLGALCCLQAWEQRAPIPGGITLEPILRRIALDYSPASLARVDTFLDALRTAKKPQPDAFLLDPAGRNLLDLLAFYVGEVLGRALRCTPEWLLREDAGFEQSMVCNFPGAATPVGVVAPLVAICGRLFGASREQGVAAHTGALLPAALRASAMPLPPAPGFGYPVDLQEAVARCGEGASLDIEAPASTRRDPLERFFAAAPQVLRSGSVAWGGVVQADAALATAAADGGAVGDVVYDPAGRAPAAVLDEVAYILSELKAQPFDDPALGEFSGYLAGTTTRVFGLDVPAAISPYPLKIATTWFERRHLPGNVLAQRSFPVVTSAAHPGIVLFLPRAAWPGPLLQAWLQSAG
jgi:hypothetical protein